MPADAADSRVLVGFLRLLRDWTQRELATAAGLHRSTICRFEEGKETPSRASIERLAKVAGVPPWAIDEVVLPAIRLARRWSEGSAAPAGEEVAMAVGEMLERDLGAAARAAVAELLASPAEADDGRDDAAGALGTQAVEVRDLSGPPDLASRERLLLPDWWQEFQNLVERLCAASARAAADDAGQALRLALLAVRVAKTAPGEQAQCWSLEGYAWAFVASAQRVAGDLPAADASFATVRALRRAGGPAGEPQPGEWRLLDLEASLRREQRQFNIALELLDRALAMAPPQSRGRLLLNRAVVLEQAGEPVQALRALREAASRVGDATDAREQCVLSFNLVVNLCHLGEYEEAAARLPALEQLTQELDHKLDTVRMRWLRGRVAAGRGQREEALTAFEQVRREFAALENGYDTALVSLELAILHLEAGRRAEVVGLAEEMLWIFRGQRVHREALAALRLFCEAAAAQTVTAELARRLLDYLEQSRHEPAPPFQPG